MMLMSALEQTSSVGNPWPDIDGESVWAAAITARGDGPLRTACEVSYGDLACDTLGRRGPSSAGKTRTGSWVNDRETGLSAGICAGVSVSFAGSTSLLSDIEASLFLQGYQIGSPSLRTPRPRGHKETARDPEPDAIAALRPGTLRTLFKALLAKLALLLGPTTATTAAAAGVSGVLLLSLLLLLRAVDDTDVDRRML
ncbi:hypothetical protein COL26b_002016 [Colletotrichum chrysophilum]|uniref:uncharacterized protein n=1 Tax=Colletotrichum chrysophilum TaxID=1836956 RepID=UPI00230143ED|nr:uncharacterized protein COL26b_002016 [Colletotrichum chrysophilum]KAJ0379863.1 hypothetical protein COL26b_002016 [Colletotrichum chrysophilum]